MRPTARFWTLGALSVVCTGWAVAVGRPLVLVSAAGVCAWLLTQQYAFAKCVSRTTDDLTVSQELSAEAVGTDTDTYCTLSVTTESPLGTHLRVDPRLPPAADALVPPLHLRPGQEEATTTTAVTWPVAGTYTVDAPTVTLRDELGLFEQRVTQGSTATITVKPAQTADVHVGEGGDPVTTGFGDHPTDQTGSGLEPRSVREYVPGDALRQIDWKATARLDETHVREFTAQTERETLLFVDHRSSLFDGTPGESKLEYLRELGLGIVATARDATDPLGCYTLSEYGITGLFEPRASADHYERISRHLYGIKAESGAPAESRTSPDDLDQSPASAPRNHDSDTNRARTLANRLDDDSPMGHALTPFLDGPNAVVRAIADSPLFAAVESVNARQSGTPWTLLLTDDTDRAELRQTVRLAAQQGGPVLVFLAPTVLYEAGGLSDLDDAYARYAEFERFRSDLAATEGVSAFEVGPADRLRAVLDRGRAERRSVSE